MMDEITAEIIGIPKGNKSLATALQELDLIKEAFQRSSRIESKILTNESAISDLQSKLNLLSTTNYVDSRFEKLQSMIDTMVKSKFDEYTSHILFEISRKVNDTDIKKALDLKVNWATFNDLKHMYGSMKMKLDTHIDVEFERYKARVNEEMNKQQEKIMQSQHQITNQLEGLSLKCENLEVKVQEVLAEDENSDEIDESDIDFDKMLTDLEKNVVPQGGVEKTMPMKAMFEETEKVNTGNKPEIIVSSLRNQGRKSTLKESRTPLVGFLEPEKEERKSTEYFGESFSPSYRKSHQEIVTRKSSMASASGGGGLKQLIRKIAVIEKDLFELFDYIRSFQGKFIQIEEDTKNIYTKLDYLNFRCNTIEEFEKTMEQNFINRLRIKDMQNQMKKNNIQIEKIPDDDLARLSKEISEKNKRIVQMENYMKYLITEVDYLKQNQSTKFRDFQETLIILEREKKTHEREVNSLKSNMSHFENTYSEYLPKMNEEIGRNIISASDLNRDRDQATRSRRKSQDSVKTCKDDRNRGISFDISKIVTHKRVSSATPKVLIKSKNLFS